MKIILIQCPCWGIYTPPLGLASLSAYLRGKGYQVLVLDLNIDMYHKCKETDRRFWDESMDEFWKNETLVEKFMQDNNQLICDYLNQICNYEAKIIGFSVYDTSMFFSLLLAKRIKELTRDKFIIFGGPHCWRNMVGKHIISNYPLVDIIVDGEGEETLLEVIESVKKKDTIISCKGALIRKDGEVLYGGRRPVIENLDNLPFPDFGDFPVGSYRAKNSIPVSTSRGCVNRCVFCYEWLYWEKYRYKSGSRIFQEIKYQLSKHPNTTNIEFYDSLVNGNLRELSVLCDLIIKENLHIQWGGQAIIHPGMNPELLVKFKRAGCVSLDYGIESGSQRLIDKIRKGFLISEAEGIIRETYMAGIDVVVNFMFGLPTETEEDFQKTLDFVYRNRDYITKVNPAPSFCGIVPGTYLFEHPEEFDISAPIDNGTFWRSNDNKNNYRVRLERFERFCKFVYNLGINCTYPKPTFINRYKVIGDYYFHIRDYSKALEYYKISIDLEGEDKKILQLIETCSQNSN